MARRGSQEVIEGASASAVLELAERARAERGGMAVTVEVVQRVPPSRLR